MSEFRLKVLIGGNVILAECSGLEPEMFIPVIVNNRITLQNVQEKRRCCHPNLNSFLKPSNKQCASTHQTNRMSIQHRVPLANSTPDRVRPSFKENQSPLRRYPTPDIVRRAAVQNKNISVSIPGLAPGLKIVRLHRVPTPNTPNKLARIAPLSRTQSPISMNLERSQPEMLRNLSNVSSFRTPLSLHSTRDTVASKSPNQSFLSGRINKTPGSATKWRKCITPQRTYIRRSNGSRKTPLKLSVKPILFEKNGNLVPDFRLNPTKNPVGDGPLTIKRRKLVIDNSLSITPKTFKHQLKHTDDLKRSDFRLPKSRKQFITSQLTAFDFLTNSCYYPRISKKLNAMFRKGCLNKQAETIKKYQQLIMDISSTRTS